MFVCDKSKQETYVAYVENLKAENRVSRERRQELMLRKWNQCIHRKDFLSSLRSRLRSLVNDSTNRQKNFRPTRSWKELAAPNYFSEQRIAVYTCILGGYDLLAKPKLKPDNIDYYVITDQPLSDDSLWNFLDVSPFDTKLEGLSAIEQNRWYKMHPHLLFLDYDYSIYLDGNITPVSDLTEFIHRIGSNGIATHNHYMRDCVYQEALAVLQNGKDTLELIELHVRFLQEQKMPKDYGLADCSVIARRHHEAHCISLMEQWWKGFLMHSRRDQISFPYVLFKNGVPMADVMTLGSNRIFNDALDVAIHLRESR